MRHILNLDTGIQVVTRIAHLELMMTTRTIACTAARSGSLVPVRSLESQSLVDLFYSLEGAGWKNKDGWLTSGTNVKRWHGITADAGNLVSLNLINNDLEVSVPKQHERDSSCASCVHQDVDHRAAQKAMRSSA